MINPAGKECKYFYGDYYRGRNHEECRLLLEKDLEWRPALCSQCPVPEIVQANGCEHMTFHPALQKPLFFMKPQVQVKAYCNKCECSVKEPRVGCGQCHPNLDFIVADSE